MPKSQGCNQLSVRNCHQPPITFFWISSLKSFQFPWLLIFLVLFYSGYCCQNRLHGNNHKTKIAFAAFSTFFWFTIISAFPQAFAKCHCLRGDSVLTKGINALWPPWSPSNLAVNRHTRRQSNRHIN